MKTKPFLGDIRYADLEGYLDSTKARNTHQIKVCEGDLFDGVAGYEVNPKENNHDTSFNAQSSINRNKTPSKLGESYTIRLSALQQRSPPNDGCGAKKLFRSHATVSPPTLAYILSNPPASSPGPESEKDDNLQRCESPNEDTPSTINKRTKSELEQPIIQIPVHSAIGGMLTLPIRPESLLQSEIWCNSTLSRSTDTDPNSASLTTFSAGRKTSEAASDSSFQEQPKVLNPLHLLEHSSDCVKNHHFATFCERPHKCSSPICQQPAVGTPKETYVEVLLPFAHCFDPTTVTTFERMPVSSPASTIRSDNDGKPQKQEPNILHSPISVLDPITGKRIFVPPFSKPNMPLPKSESKVQRPDRTLDISEQSCSESKEEESEIDRASS